MRSKCVLTNTVQMFINFCRVNQQTAVIHPRGVWQWLDISRHGREVFEIGVKPGAQERLKKH